MNHDHQDAACPHCVATENQAEGNKASGPSSAKAPACVPRTGRSAGREKLRAFCGVCGCLSCYVAMFPAIVLGIVGILGLSSSQTLAALNAYMGSALFQPILIISILLLIIGLLRYGRTPLVLSVLAGVGIFVSMNFYMRAWLFTLSFAVLALAYYLAFRKTKTQQLKIALVLLLAVVVLGVIDLGRSILFAPSEPPSTNSMGVMQ